MYLAHFKLKRKPFELGPDPRFLLSTPMHNEAMASLYYAMKYRKGFAVLSGEVGTGKTLVLNCLLSLLHSREFSTAYVSNPRMNSAELIRYIVADFGLRCEETRGRTIQELNKFLLAERLHGRTAVVIIDEAQQLDNDVLEEIRLLTNLESTEEKLLQIVLAGQPELDEKLDSTELRQLKQRIAVRCRLEALSEAATLAYVRRRLEVAGATPSMSSALFPAETMGALFRHSRGTPRLINVICDNALIASYADGADHVTASTIDEVAHDLRLGVCSNRPSRPADRDISVTELLRRVLEVIDQEPKRPFSRPEGRG